MWLRPWFQFSWISFQLILAVIVLLDWEQATVQNSHFPLQILIPHLLVQCNGVGVGFCLYPGAVEALPW